MSDLMAELKPCPFCGEPPETESPVSVDGSPYGNYYGSLFIFCKCAARPRVGWGFDCAVREAPRRKHTRVCDEEMGKVVETWNRRAGE